MDFGLGIFLLTKNFKVSFYGSFVFGEFFYGPKNLYGPFYDRALSPWQNPPRSRSLP